MTFTGGISFFDRPYNLLKDGASVTASSNNGKIANYILSPQRNYRWTSSGSNDTTTETLTITLPQSREIDSLFLHLHNFKEFGVTYGAGASAFTGVVGLDGSKSGISETAFDGNTSFYKFDAVTTNQINITVDKTQTVDAEKFLASVFVTKELGTLEGYPDIGAVKYDRNDNKSKVLSGRDDIEKSYAALSFKISLRAYPFADDVELLESLYDRERPFMTWVCGGVPSNFRIKQRGFRVEDIIITQVDRALNNSYYKNIYTLGVVQRYSFTEVVP